MAVGWIARNKAGIVRAFCDVAYADPLMLDGFKEGGKTVELIEAERIILNQSIPADARILATIRPTSKSQDKFERRSCLTKIRYKMQPSCTMDQYAYPCKFCGGWHKAARRDSD